MRLLHQRHDHDCNGVVDRTPHPTDRMSATSLPIISADAAPMEILRAVTGPKRADGRWPNASRRKSRPSARSVQGGRRAHSLHGNARVENARAQATSGLTAIPIDQVDSFLATRPTARDSIAGMLTLVPVRNRAGLLLRSSTYQSAGSAWCWRYGSDAESRLIIAAHHQVTAIPLRLAAPRHGKFWSSRRRRLGVGRTSWWFVVIRRDHAEKRFHRSLSPGADWDLRIWTPPVKRARIGTVWNPVPRADIPAKVSGGLIYVHDMRVPACCTPASCARPMPASIVALRSGKALCRSTRRRSRTFGIVRLV